MDEFDCNFYWHRVYDRMKPKELKEIKMAFEKDLECADAILSKNFINKRLEYINKLIEERKK